MQHEAVEPSRNSLPLCHPFPHGPVAVHPHGVARDKRRGVYYGYARAFAKNAGLKECQKVQSDQNLPLDEAVVGYGDGACYSYMVQVERLEIAEVVCVEQHQNGHCLAVGYAAGVVAVVLAGDSTGCSFSSGAKYLQNSSRMQKMSIKFIVVLGVRVSCNCLIITYKITKNIPLLQIFRYFSYTELTLF